MGKIRIYELAKELGLENKVLLAKAQELGMKGKSSHSNSLDPDEAELLRRSFIREAIGQRPDSEVVKTKVDTETGEKSTVVERRKGNVIRRRRRSTGVESEPEEVLAGPPVEESEPEPAPAVEELVIEEPAEEEIIAEVEEVPVALVAEEIIVDEPEVVVETTPAAEKRTIGPKVLGRIELPTETRPKVVKGRRVATLVVDEEPESDDDERRDPKRRTSKKRSRKRSFSRGDLVDYEGRPTRRGKGGGRERGGDFQTGDPGIVDTRMKASKRVIRMAGEAILVGDLAKQMSLKAGEVISKLIDLGIMATINQAIDQDTVGIVAEEFGYTVESVGFHEEDILKIDVGVEDAELLPRPPVVTVMGHVDHGKTSLLDCIRKASVADGEHGGITQHIGAYSVQTDGNRIISFVDTPGHEAFTAMRARGAQVTDIVVLVVAADDGVMPQTVEAINHSKAAGVPIVVAINKMDRPDANPDRVKQQLAERGLQPEEWGGDTLFFPVAAINGTGVAELLEGILLVAEMRELRAPVDQRAQGAIIEARQELGRGTVATVLVQSGTLKVGDIFVAGAEYGRVRSMTDHRGERLDTAGPSMPVEITGCSGIPLAGDDFIVVGQESQAKQVAANRADILRQKDQLNLAGGPISLEEFARQAGKEQSLQLNVVLKADVHGSLEAVRDSVENLSTEKVTVRVLHAGVGAMTESDVQLAIASKAIIVGFNVRGEPRALREAENSGIEVRFYRIIYELLDDVRQAMAGMLAPVQEEVHLAWADVRDTFTVPKVGTVAGCYITDGTVRRGSLLRLLRNDRVVHQGRMLALRRFKEDVKEVQSGYECGISFEGFNDIQLGDRIEVFSIKEVAATLD